MKISIFRRIGVGLKQTAPNAWNLQAVSHYPFPILVKTLLTTLFLIIHLTVLGQTNIYIVGTVHDRTRNFNPDSILNILTKLKPDLILMELDSSYFDSDFNVNIRTRTNETLGVKKYLSKHPTPIRPYDIKGRNRALNVSEIEGEALYRIGRIEWTLDSVQRQSYTDFKRTNKELISFLKKKPYEINQPYTNVLVEKNQKLIYEDFLEMIESRSEFEDLRVSFRQSVVFWDLRNQKMVHNTLDFLNKEIFQDKTIVLFTGFIHKYYLLNELLPKQEQYGFIVKEYF